MKKLLTVPWATILVIIFGLFKVGGVDPFAAWSWWLVFSPWLVCFALIAVGIAIMLGVAVGEKLIAE